MRKALIASILSLLPFAPLKKAKAYEETLSYILVSQELKVLSATGEEEALSRIPRYTIVITREEIDKIGARNLFELLESLPEFYVWRSHFGLKAVGSLGIRQSYYSEKIQVLIDGMPTLNPTNGSSLSTNNNFSLSNVKQVEITYGPMTSLYGFNSSLVVINLVTYSPEDLKFNSSASISTGGDRDIGAAAAFESGSFKGSVSVDYNEWHSPHKEYTDFLGYSGIYSPDSKHASYYAKVEHSSGLFLKSYGVDRDDHFPLSIWGFFTYKDNSYARRRAFLNQVGYRGELPGEFRYTLTASLNYFYLKRGYKLCPPFEYCKYLFPYGFYAVEERKTLEPKLDLRIRKSLPKGKLLFGLSYSEARLYSTSLKTTFDPAIMEIIAQQVSSSLTQGTPINISQIAQQIETFPMREMPEDKKLLPEIFRATFSPFFQYFVNWGDNSVILNARWDRTNDAGKDWSFSLSYMRHLTDRLRLKLNMGRALRIPSFEEMYIKNNAFLIGNPELKIEKEDSIIPSLEYGGNNLSVKAMVYQSRFKNFIYKKPLSPITYMWDNSDETVKVSGGSLEVKKRLWDFWEARVAVHRRFHIKGPDSPYLEFPKDKLVAGLTYCLHGTVIDLTTVAYSRVSDKVPGFYYTNLTINKRLSPRLKLSFQIKNLTDKDFFYPNGIPGEERSGWLSLRYSF